MKSKVVLFFSTLCLFAFVCVNLKAQNVGGQQVEFFVSPTGNTLAEGTKSDPFPSLIDARNAIRTFKSKHKNNVAITVWFADGLYEMKEPFVFLPEDGGRKDAPVLYKAMPGANPVFSGGKQLNGFEITENGCWKLSIPECKYYNWRFDQLYVNGKRAQLARTPNIGFLKINEVQQNIWERGTGREAERAQQILSFDETNFAPLKNVTNQEIDLVRFRAFHKWDFTLRYIDKLEKDSCRLYTSGKGMKPWNPLFKGGRVIVENFEAALDEPGEWFLDKEGTLFYMPLPGETPANSVVIAPALGNLIKIKGDAVAKNCVEYLQFEGLSFRYCHYRIPQSGSEPNQAAILINAGVMLEGVSNISFKDCEILHTGQHALWFGKGCSNSTVEHCLLTDLGGGGVYIGDSKALEEEHTHHITVHNSIIQKGGREFPAAVGVWVGHSSDNEISHNDIANFYYTGVSVGWVWGYTPSNAKRNKVIYNHIHHIGWTLLSDMAAVYTLGKSEGTEISNNVIHHVHAYSYGGWGLYTDEGSSGIKMENNLVYNTKTGGFHQHYGKENIINNNIFAFAKQYQVQCTRVEKHRSFNFRNNIVLFDEGVVLQGPWKKIDVGMDKNLYWNISGSDYSFDGSSFKEWQKSGHDKHSLIANPYFKNPAAFDFQITKKRNCKRIGFVPFDYSKAGVYGSEEWKQKAKLSESVLKAFDKEVEENCKAKK